MLLSISLGETYFGNERSPGLPPKTIDDPRPAVWERNVSAFPALSDSHCSVEVTGFWKMLLPLLRDANLGWGGGDQIVFPVSKY